MSTDILYQIALTQIPNIGAVQAKQLIEHFGDAATIFKASKKELSTIEGIGELKAKAIKSFDDFTPSEYDLTFFQNPHIITFFLPDIDYPQRLLHCYDAPTILFSLGNADLNATKIISIIGTRSNTDYGKQITEQLIAGLQSLNVLIVSGLAFGVDAIAHKAAIQNSLSTVGVLAHG